MKIFAMVPARSGSKGLPDKNIKPAGGTPLVCHAVNFARKLGVDQIVVSTDSETYFNIAANGNDEDLLWHHRADFSASDTAMEEDIISDYAARCHGYGMPDIWIWLKPTSPFRSVISVEGAIRKLVENPHIDSARIVCEADARLQTVGELGWLEPLLPLVWPHGRSKARRTEFPKAYKPFNLEIFRHEGWASRGAYFMGHKILPVYENEITGLDVDDARDLDLIDLIMKADPRPEWLKPYIHA